MSKRTNTLKKKSLVDDYNIIKPREARYRESNVDTLRKTSYWLTTRRLFNFEIKPILNDQIRLKDLRQEKYPIPDILFEYLVVRTVTLLEIQLKYYCRRYVEKFPKKAEKLLNNYNEEKDLAIQILSTYSFSNLQDIKHVFSTLLGKDFFQILRHRSEERKSSIGYEGDHLYRASPLFKKWGMFKLLIKLRNEFIHENKHIHIRTKTLKKNLLNTIYEVNYITSLEESNVPYDNDSFSEIIPDY